MADLYRLLKVRRTATAEEITAAYRKLAMQYHPDRNPGDPKAAERMTAINAAYAVLSGPERRKRYDETGETVEPRAPDHIIEILGDMLRSLMRHLQDGQARVQDVDLATQMRAAIARRQQDIRQAMLPVFAERDVWKATLGRFTVPAGENLPEAIAFAHVQWLDRQIEAMEAEVARLGEVADYLKTVKYRTDNAFSGVMDAWGVNTFTVPSPRQRYGKW